MSDSKWTPEMEKELAERAQFQMSRSDRAFREPEVSGELLLAALAEIRRLRIEVAKANKVAAQLDRDWWRG